MIDTHAHINMLKNPSQEIENSISKGVKTIIVPASSPEDFGDILKLAEMHGEIYAALGVHPEEISKCAGHTLKNMYNLAAENEKIVAIGEIGLDYYWDRTNIEEQKTLFKNQIELAVSLNLPILVHDREAHADTFEILKNSGVKKAILHCFSGGAEFAEKCVKEGWLLGIGGIVTFKNSKKMKQVVKNIPLTSLVLETDAPFLTPHPFRGEENSPKYLEFIAKEIANIKDTTFEHVDKVTTQNALNFFNIKGEDL